MDRWTLDGGGGYGLDLSTSPAVLPNGNVLWPGPGQRLRAVSPTGRLLWELPFAGDVTSPAVTAAGYVVIGIHDPCEYGLDPENEAVRWRFRRGHWTYSSPGVTADGVVYFGDHANQITGLDAATGRLVFRFAGSRRRPLRHSIGIWTAVLSDVDHRTYVGTRQGFVYGVDRAGHLLWQLDTGATVDSYPARTGDGALIVGITDGRLLAIADS